MQAVVATLLPRLTIGVVDQLTGWTFALHSDERRVWLDAYGTDAPVPLDYIAGRRSLELQTAASGCREVDQFLAVAREILPTRIAVVPISQVKPSAPH
jgi:hypothetical protein